MSEGQYLSALKLIRDRGTRVEDRTGIGARWHHGLSMKFWLSHGKVPLRTKKINWHVPLDELLWFIRGEHKSIDDFKIGDFDIQGYYPLARIKAPVAV